MNQLMSNQDSDFHRGILPISNNAKADKQPLDQSCPTRADKCNIYSGFGPDGLVNITSCICYDPTGSFMDCGNIRHGPLVEHKKPQDITTIEKRTILLTKRVDSPKVVKREWFNICTHVLRVEVQNEVTLVIPNVRNFELPDKDGRKCPCDSGNKIREVTIESPIWTKEVCFFLCSDASHNPGRESRLVKSRQERMVQYLHACPAG
jgi:hypothetical protein